jgi:hypothetical protein
MTRAYLGDLSITIPDGWQDQSVLSFIGPPAPSARMLTAKPESRERPNLMIKRDAFAGDVPLETYARAQEEVLLRVVPGARLVERGELEILGSVKAATCELALPSPIGELRQLQVHFRLDGAYYTFAGTAPLSLGFDGERKRFLDVVRSLERRA